VQGVAQCLQGAWEQCLLTAEQTLEIAQHVGAPYMRSMGCVFEGMARFHRGERAAGLALIAHSAEELEEAQTRLALSLVYAQHAELLVEDLQWEAARTQAEGALARAVEEDPLGEVAAHRVLASIAARGPALDWAGAQQHLEVDPISWTRG